MGEGQRRESRGVPECERAVVRVVKDVRSSSGWRADVVGVVAEHGVVTVTVELDDGVVSWAFALDDKEEKAAVVIAQGLQYQVERNLRLPWPACGGSLTHSLIPLIHKGVGAWGCDRHQVHVRIGELLPAES